MNILLAQRNAKFYDEILNLQTRMINSFSMVDIKQCCEPGSYEHLTEFRTIKMPCIRQTGKTIWCINKLIDDNGKTIIITADNTSMTALIDVFKNTLTEANIKCIVPVGTKLYYGFEETLQSLLEQCDFVIIHDSEQVFATANKKELITVITEYMPSVRIKAPPILVIF